jgi:hypothetical protein
MVRPRLAGDGRRYSRRLIYLTVSVPDLRFLLALALTVLEPATLALAASGRLSAIIDRGGFAVAFLVFRLAVTGLAMMTGVALWQRRPGAVPLTRIALVLLAVCALGAQWNALWPGQLPPGLAGPALALTMAWYGFWYWYVNRMKNDE